MPSQTTHTNSSPAAVTATTTMTSLPTTAPERTKTRLLELVKRHGPLTAQDIAQHLDISTPAARRHLCDLQEQRLVQARTERPGGRGRPQHVYALTEHGEAAFPRTYSSLCLDVLKHIQDLFGQGAVLQVLDARSAEIAQRLKTELPTHLPIEERLERLTRQLNAMGFDARYEQHAGTWYFIQDNCPNLAVARQHQQLCHSEMQMYAEVLGLTVTRETRIACGQSSCRYRLG